MAEIADTNVRAYSRSSAQQEDSDCGGDRENEESSRDLPNVMGEINELRHTTSKEPVNAQERDKKNDGLPSLTLENDSPQSESARNLENTLKQAQILSNKGFELNDEELKDSALFLLRNVVGTIMRDGNLPIEVKDDKAAAKLLAEEAKQYIVDAFRTKLDWMDLASPGLSVFLRGAHALAGEDDPRNPRMEVKYITKHLMQCYLSDPEVATAYRNDAAMRNDRTSKIFVRYADIAEARVERMRRTVAESQGPPM